VDQDIASPSEDQDPRTSRTRRTAGEPTPSDPANIPHKRVHRVQQESDIPDIPHSRSPREEVVDSEAAHSETPLHFTGFQFPQFHVGRREHIPRGRTARFQSATRIPARFNPELRFESGKIRSPEDDIISPESQRFYPTFNGRHPPFPPSRQPFFPSPPLPSRVPGPRGGRFISHNQGNHKDFHNSFHGPGVREAFHKPGLTFSPSRRPFHREQEFEHHDNSLLGSGNFEVLSGGTFYDNDDPNLHNHEYDHLLDDDYGTYTGVRNRPHSNNYVDDFFSNFRDFSEFAARKSDEGESVTYLEDVDPYSRGYASEHVEQIAAESTHSDQSVGEKEKANKTPTQDTLDKKLNGGNNSTVKTDVHKHRQPKNIQDVLEEVDPRPSEYSASSITVDEKDPMIAMF